MIYRYFNFFLCLLLSIGAVIAPSSQNTHNHVDLWPKLRQNFRLVTAPSLERSTRQQIRWHQNHPDAITGMSENAKLYLGYVTQQTINQNLPTELALIPFIESNFNPYAQSSKGASGLWQIMPDLASASNLVINRHLDERRDIQKSTQAALAHLKYLHGRLDHRWDYAIAAYSAGEGRVRQAVKQAKRTKNSSWVDFLPAETRQYLPKLYAIKRIIKDPDKYGIQLPKISAEPQFSVNPITRSFAFDHLTEICGTDKDQLLKLNPSWKGHFINHEFSNVVVVPKQSAFSCHKKMTRIPLFNNRWAYHKVRQSDTLTRIAKLYRTSVESIVQYNGLTSHTIYPNTHLIIKIGDKNPPVVSNNPVLSEAVIASESSGPTQLQHVVQSGDTIESIAKHYTLKAEHIAYWNQLRYPYSLQAGKKLVLWRHTSPRVRYIKYQVRPGDTVFSIAKKHKISQKQLLSANKIANINMLKVNQVLTIRQP
tara:strand:+ start:529 stop:1971 length:1443 start_codon:yes stop_codon:yes gene_type:complete